MRIQVIFFYDLRILKLDDIYKINVSKFILAFMKHELPQPIMTLYTHAQNPQKTIILDQI